MAKKPSTIATLKCIAIDAEAMRDAALSRNATLQRKLDAANAQLDMANKQLEDLRHPLRTVAPGPVAGVPPADNTERRNAAMRALRQAPLPQLACLLIVEAIDAYVTARPG